MNRYELGNYLSAIRLEKGKKMKDVAEEAGLRVEHIQRFERAAVLYPSESTVKAIAKVYGVPFKKIWTVFVQEVQPPKASKLDAALDEISKDKKFKLRLAAARHGNKYEMPDEIKKLIIELYDESKAKKPRK